MDRTSSTVDATDSLFGGQVASAPHESRVRRTNEEIEGWLIERIATLSNMETQEVDRDRPFADFSMDSSVIITVTQELSRWLDEEISVTIFWELPTIRDLVRGLTAAAT
jgi:acyl carrier protein